MSLKPAWLYRQSAAIPYRMADGAIEVLLITSMRRKRWIIPKGVVEPWMTPAASALKEAWEEAGIEGEISRAPIGEYRYRKWGGTCTVEVFTLLVTEVFEEWPESAERKRKWLPLKEAIEKVEDADMRDMLRLLPPAIVGKS